MFFDKSHGFLQNKDFKTSRLFYKGVPIFKDLIRYNCDNNNFFLIKNKYNFFNIELSFFNSAKEERINNKFIKTLIERSVDFLLIKKIDSFYFIAKKNAKIVSHKQNHLTVLFDTNFINIKKLYFKIFVSKIKKLFYKLTTFDFEKLSYFTKKNILNFCIININKNFFQLNLFNFSFSLIYQKVYLDCIIFNYSKFFFCNVTNFFFNKFLFQKKKILNYSKFLTYKKRYILFYLFDKYTNFLLNNKSMSKNYKLSYNKFYNNNNILDLKKNLLNYNSLIFLGEQRINFYFEQKINIFCSKLGFFDNLNFFFSINKFKKISVFLNLFNFKVSFFDNLKFFQFKGLNLKQKILLKKFNKNNFRKYNFNKNLYKFLLKNKSTSSFYFLKDKNILFYNLIKNYNDNYTFDFFDTFFLFSSFKIHKIKNFFITNKIYDLFYYLKKTKNLILENLNIEKINPKTYYKKFFLREKCEDIFSVMHSLILKLKLKKKFNNYKVSFENFKFLFDNLFKKNFKIKILLKKKNQFFKKFELNNFISKLFKNFSYFFFLNNRKSYNEFSYLLSNILIFFNKNKYIKKFFFFNKFNKKNIFNDLLIFKKYNLFIKKYFVTENFLINLIKLSSNKQNNSKIFIKKYYNNKLNFSNFYFNFIINLNYNFIFFSKYNQILKSWISQKYSVKNYYDFKQRIIVFKNFLKLNNFKKQNFGSGTLENFFLVYIIYNFKIKVLNIFNFKNINLGMLSKKLKYRFYIINTVLLKYLNKILNLSFSNYFNINEKQIFYQNIQKTNFFYKNLFIFMDNILKIDNLNFQNFEFLLFFDFNNKKSVNFNNGNLLKKNKIHFKFLKTIINIYLNFIFLKKKFFKKIKFNFYKIVFNNTFSLVLKKHLNLLTKFFNLFNKSNLYLKKNMIIFYRYINSFLKFLYLKTFFYKKFIYFYMKIFYNFLKFIKLKFFESFNFINLDNIDLKIYSFFFFLSRKNQKKKNLLWLKVNFTKRNIFVNLFVDQKKPSVFVFTAGQTFFEGRLKKTKEAGIVIGRKLWKRIVLLSKKNFVYENFTFKNFHKTFNILKFNKQNFYNTKFNKSNFFKNYLINLKNILSNKIDRKKKIFYFLKNKKIIFFSKIINVKFLLKKKKLTNFFMVNYKNKNNNFALNLNNIFKTKIYFNNKISDFYNSQIYLLKLKKYKFIFKNIKFLKFNIFKMSINNVNKQKKLNEITFIRKWIIKKKIFNKKKRFYKRKKYAKYKILIIKKRKLIKNKKLVKIFIRKFQRFKKIELYVKKLFFLSKLNKNFQFLKKINFLLLPKFNLFFKYKDNNLLITKANFKFIKKSNIFFFMNLKLKKNILINFSQLKKKFYIINNKKYFLLLKKKINCKYFVKKKRKFFTILFFFKNYKILKLNVKNLIFYKIKNFLRLNFMTFFNNKKLLKINRINLFLKFNKKQKQIKYFNLLKIFFFNSNFYSFIRSQPVYKLNIYKKKYFIKKKIFNETIKKFCLKIKFFNYFLNILKNLKNNMFDKKFPYNKQNAIQNFSFIVVNIIKKINYLFYKYLIPKFLEKKDYTLLKISRNRLPLIKYSLHLVKQLNFIFKNFINDIKKINKNFMNLKKYEEKKIRYKKYKIILKSFFNNFGPLYRLISKYLRSNFLYEFLLVKKKPLFKEKNIYIMRFINLFYFLQRILKNVKNKVLNFVNYTDFHKSFRFSSDNFIKKKKFSEIYKKKKLFRNFLVNKSKQINQFPLKLNFILKKKKNIKNFFKKLVYTFFFFKNLKIKVYKKLFKYSIFFDLRLNFIQKINNKLNKINLNIISKQLFFKGIKKQRRIKFKKFFKVKIFNRHFNYYKFKNLLKKNLWLNKQKFINKKQKKKKLNIRKLNGFFLSYLNLVFFFRHYKLNFVKKIMFLIQFIKFFYFFRTIKKFNKRFLFNSFIKFFYIPYLNNIKETKKYILLKKFKKVFRSFFFNPYFTKNMKLKIFVFFNKKKFNQIKLLNYKFFYFLKKTFNKKFFKYQLFTNNILNTFFVLNNNIFFKNFFNKFISYKTSYFYLTTKIKKFFLLYNFINNFVCKKKFTYNKYKILINHKNFITYKKFFINIFTNFLNIMLKRTFWIKKIKNSVNYNKKLLLFSNYNFFFQTKKKFINCKLFLKYNLIFFILKFYKFFFFGKYNKNLIIITKFSKNLINLENFLYKKINKNITILKIKADKLKNLKKIQLFLKLNPRLNKINNNNIIVNKLFLFKNNERNILNLKKITIKNVFIKKKKIINIKNIKLKRFSINLMTSLFFFNKFKSIIFSNLYLLMNKIDYLKLFSLKKINKNIFKRWRKYYSNFENKHFVPKRGFLLILTKKKNRVVRGIYKGFMQQARGKKLFKRLRPRFIKYKKFIFTRSRKVKGKRK